MKKLLFIFLLLSVLKSYSQDNIVFTPTLGIKSFSTIGVPIQGNFDGILLGYNISTENNNSDWVRLLNVKYIATQFTYINMTNMSYTGISNSKGVFGENYILSTGIGIELYKINQLQLFFVPKLGMSYSDKDFYNTYNINQSIGSHINIVTEGELSLKYNVLKVGINISHQSNSNTTAPNGGINRIGYLFGLVLNEDTSSPRNSSDFTNTYNIPDNTLDIDLIYGITGRVRTGYYVNKITGKGMYPDTTALQTNTPPFYKAEVSLAFTHHLNSVVGIKVGTDAIYNFTTLNYNKFFETYQGAYASYNHLNVGLNMGAELNLNKFSFSGVEGYYVTNGLLYSQNRLYTSFNVKYFITNNVGIEVKSYLSDFGGIGLAIRL